MADNQQHIDVEAAKKALEKGLEHRPSKEELIDHNILKGMMCAFCKQDWMIAFLYISALDWIVVAKIMRSLM